jgi:hypothetical protein
MGHEPKSMNSNPTNAMSAIATEPAATRPKVGQYKGHPMIILNPDDRFPFQFGLNKARMVLQHIDAIRSFVETTERAAAPAEAVAA